MDPNDVVFHVREGACALPTPGCLRTPTETEKPRGETAKISSENEQRTKALGAEEQRKEREAIAEERAASVQKKCADDATKVSEPSSCALEVVRHCENGCPNPQPTSAPKRSFQGDKCHFET